MALDAAARQKARRERLRAQGLRPVQLWVPDTKSPQFAARVRRQCQALASDPREAEINDWLAEAMADMAGHDDA
jgi:hypothetical protein